MAGVTKASDLVPGLYDDNDGDESNYASESESEEEILHEDSADGTIKFDLFNLAAFNHNGLRDAKEATLLESTTHTAQMIVKRLFALNHEVTEVGPVVTLPTETSLMPREKRVPEAKPETKWEKYAKEKGIQKKKKERMVWDEEQQKYLPRWGYKRASDGIELHGIEEIKEGHDASIDPFEKKREEKKANVQKNMKQQIGNLRRAGKLPKKGAKSSVGGDVSTFDSASMPGIASDLDGKRKKGKAGVRSTLELVQRSTASMGRYDTARKGEPAIKLKGLKRSFKDNMVTGASEKDAMKAQLRIVADLKDKKDKGVTNSLKPYAGIIPDADVFKFKKGKSKGASVETGPSKKKTKRK